MCECAGVADTRSWPYYLSLSVYVFVFMGTLTRCSVCCTQTEVIDACRYPLSMCGTSECS